jgi:hypothetical protein
MSALTLQKDGSTAVPKTIQDIFAEVFDDNRRSEKTVPGTALMPKESRNKVVMLRRQLVHGTYNVNERLDPVLESILKDIKQQ